MSASTTRTTSAEQKKTMKVCSKQLGNSACCADCSFSHIAAAHLEAVKAQWVAKKSCTVCTFDLKGRCMKEACTYLHVRGMTTAEPPAVALAAAALAAMTLAVAPAAAPAVAPAAAPAVAPPTGDSPVEAAIKGMRETLKSLLKECARMRARVANGDSDLTLKEVETIEVSIMREIEIHGGNFSYVLSRMKGK